MALWRMFGLSYRVLPRDFLSDYPIQKSYEAKEVDREPATEVSGNDRYGSFVSGGFGDGISLETCCIVL